MTIHTLQQAERLAISAVVCTYTEDRWDRFRAAVSSLQAQRPLPAEIIVVVDHNRPLFERVRREVPGVVVLENGFRRGLSGARNTAIGAAGAPVVAFLDDDAEAHPEWLARLLAHMEDPDVVGVGGAVRPVWASGRPAWFPREFDWVVGCTYEGVPTSLAPVRNPFGGALAIRRDVVASVGGYETGLGRVGDNPLGCEETELCLRVRRHQPGAVFLYEPAAEILHHIPVERATWRYFRRRCHAEGLSKSVVRRLSRGDRDGGLATERAYVTRTLPRGIGRGLAGIVRGDVSGLRRAGAILAGLTVTTYGFVQGGLTARAESTR